MRKLVAAVACAYSIVASTTFARTSCPDVGQTYPWMIPELMRGDYYANVYIDIDRTGRPLQCKIGQTNIEETDRFWICNAFMQQFRTQPPVELAKGERTTIERRFVSYGDEHRKAERKAKKEFLQKNPSAKTGCYPGADEY